MCEQEQALAVPFDADRNPRATKITYGTVFLVLYVQCYIYHTQGSTMLMFLSPYQC